MPLQLHSVWLGKNYITTMYINCDFHAACSIQVATADSSRRLMESVCEVYVCVGVCVLTVVP